jgi:hypothetical protein
VPRLAVEAEEVLLENELAPARDEEGVDERGPADGRIAVGDLLDERRERRLVHTDVAGARRGPAVAGRGGLRVDVARRAGRAGKEAGGLIGCRPRQLDRAAHVRPGDPEAVRRNERRGVVDLVRGIGARAEVDGVAFPGDAVLIRAARGVLLRVPEGGQKLPRRVAEDPEVKRELLGKGLDDPAPGIPAGESEHEG